MSNGLIANAEEVATAYDDVRSDDTETTWLLLEYEDSSLKLTFTGTEYDELVEKFAEDNRAYAYVRFTTGDEMSKRAKFALITWMGESVSPLKRAKMSTDKAEVKRIINNFGVEIQASEREEVTFEAVQERLVKAGGANYGTGGN